jgi:hypothetical protein
MIRIELTKDMVDDATKLMRSVNKFRGGTAGNGVMAKHRRLCALAALEMFRDAGKSAVWRIPKDVVFIYHAGILQIPTGMGLFGCQFELQHQSADRLAKGFPRHWLIPKVTPRGVGITICADFEGEQAVVFEGWSVCGDDNPVKGVDQLTPMPELLDMAENGAVCDESASDPEDIQKLMNQSKGRQANASGYDLEAAFARWSLRYLKVGICCMARMPVPTVPSRVIDPYTGQTGSMRRLSGNAPFDNYGYMMSDVTMTSGRILTVGKFIGVELKTTSQFETSLPIVPPEGKGNGLKYHQLCALAHLSVHGIGRVIWDNGGKLGVLLEDQVIFSHHVYEQAMAGKAPQRGTKSIPWGSFKEMPPTIVGGTPAFEWLRV